MIGLKENNSNEKFQKSKMLKILAALIVVASWIQGANSASVGRGKFSNQVDPFLSVTANGCIGLVMMTAPEARKIFFCCFIEYL